MSETTETTEPAQVESPFPAVLAKTGQPEQVTSMIEKKLTGLFELVARHNARALRIQQTKAQDPNNQEVLDALWRTNVEGKSAPAEILEAEANYQALIEEAEQLLTKLRGWAKTQIKPPLSEAELEKERKAANEEAALIETERGGAEGMAAIADQFLTLAGSPIEGGILSLIPSVQSIKPTRGGKKSGGSSGGGTYRTRIDSVVMNGEPAIRTFKKKGVDATESNLIIAADKLNRMWNADKLTANTVNDEDLERAMYASHNVEFRDATSLPVVVEFDFNKEIQVQNANDDGTHTELQKVRFVVTRNVIKKKEDDSTSATSTEEKSADEKPAEAKSESVPANEPAEEKVAEEKVSELKPEVPAPVNKKQAAIQNRAAK